MPFSCHRSMIWVYYWLCQPQDFSLLRLLCLFTPADRPDRMMLLQEYLKHAQKAKEQFLSPKSVLPVNAEALTKHLSKALAEFINNSIQPAALKDVQSLAHDRHVLQAVLPTAVNSLSDCMEVHAQALYTDCLYLCHLSVFK